MDVVQNIPLYTLITSMIRTETPRLLGAKQLFVQKAKIHSQMATYQELNV